MKRTLLFLYLALGICVYAQNHQTKQSIPAIALSTTPTDLVPTAGLVAYYPFNNNANDESGQKYNGTVNGATLTADRDQAPNGAYQFDGVSNYILIGDPVPAGLQIQNEITLSAWIYATQYPSSQDLWMIVGSQCDACSNKGISIFLDGRTNSDSQTSPAGHIHFQIGGNSNWHASNSNSTVPLNQWVNIVAVRKATQNAIIYYNGISQPLTSYYWNGTIDYSGAYLAIGRQRDYTNRFFNGKIDEVRIYNRALSATEVAALYQDMAIRTSADTICSNNPAEIQLRHSQSNISYQLLDNGVETGNPQTGTGGTLIFNSDVLTSNSTFSLKAKDNTSGNSLVLDTILSIVVNPLPTVTLTPIQQLINISSDPIALSGTPEGGVFSGTGVSGTVFNPKTAGLGTKTIHYSYSNNYGCSALATQNVLVYDTTGVVCQSYDTVRVSVTDTLYIKTLVTNISAPDYTNTLRIYPNPAKDYIIIDYGDCIKIAGYHIEILSPTGQVVFSNIISQQSSAVSLNNWVKNGIYLVYLYNTENKLLGVRKIVIK